MRLIIVRHGDPNYEIDSLTEKGWREAEFLSVRMEKQPGADICTGSTAGTDNRSGRL